MSSPPWPGRPVSFNSVCGIHVMLRPGQVLFSGLDFQHSPTSCGFMPRTPYLSFPEWHHVSSGFSFKSCLCGFLPLGRPCFLFCTTDLKTLLRTARGFRGLFWKIYIPLPRVPAVSRVYVHVLLYTTRHYHHARVPGTWLRRTSFFTGPAEKSFCPQRGWELGTQEDTVGTNGKYGGPNIGELGGGDRAAWEKERDRCVG